ncbi:MAG: hypothetical protein HZT41_03885 [Dechloromonas sp.]|nr:MAG: hypothetical protein HZT41_03885 [Dechloromonas sp.]
MVAPSDNVLSAFDEIAAPIDQRIVENEEQMRILATLRDTLLPRLISGQLRLPEAEGRPLQRCSLFGYGRSRLRYNSQIQELFHCVTMY